MWIASSLSTVKTPTVIALGNFDGVHRGHQSVIGTILANTNGRWRSDQDCVKSSSWVTAPRVISPRIDFQSQPLVTVVSFSPHPQEFFTGQRRLLLTPLAEKAKYLQAIGVEQIVLLPFNAELAALTPPDFVEQILVRGLQAQRISVGKDFRFGQGRSGTITDLQQLAAPYGITVEVAPLYLDHDGRISSSRIREALRQGDIAQANQLLGRPYQLVGEVVTGRQLGRTIGFPTANLKLPEDKFLPCCGVYSVWVSAAEEQNHPGVMNIGYRPTVEGQQLTVEIHLFDWSGDLYGHTLTVSLVHFLRPEQKFPSLEALKAQIQQDCDQARRGLNPSCEIIGPTP
ncbi:MAG: bifunctional riboflavin kinase/FAD synthetase [Elainella sp. Prado103]|nr:bifunctional riboflavin kinase/FAD synthetase [Elainella sp. Prado103]